MLSFYIRNIFINEKVDRFSLNGGNRCGSAPGSFVKVISSSGTSALSGWNLLLLLLLLLLIIIIIIIIITTIIIIIIVVVIIMIIIVIKQLVTRGNYTEEVFDAEAF